MADLEVTEAELLQLRELTGVASNEYELDGVDYWTDEQLTVVLEAHATDEAFDIASAAAYVLDSWAAQLARAYDVTMDGQTLARSQMLTAVQARAEEMRARSGTEAAKTVQLEAPMLEVPRKPRPQRWNPRRRWKGIYYRW